jgi:hypothetical protein
MAAGTASTLQRRFALDPGILGPGSALSLELAGSTDQDVVLALSTGKPLPKRPGGVLELGRIGLAASGGDEVTFHAGKTTAAFQFSAGVAAGVGVYDEPHKALDALDLGEAPGLDVDVGDSATTRFLLLRAGYRASGSVEGAHPIGAVGSFTFGVSAAASGVSAVLHRFEDETPAVSVLESAVTSWRLPRHAADLNGAGELKLAPNTWLIAEADGSLAVRLGARVGYDFSFVREARLGGLSGDVGLKIDAAARAAFGFEVSGRYLVVLGRESQQDTLRLRLFKLSRNGINFGLNFKVGVQGVDTLSPGKADDFLKAVFGVHGAQIVKALGQIENWTDPSNSVGELVAGLTNKKALELLRDMTGVDPEAAFDTARRKLIETIRLWESLPERASSELLDIFGALDDSGIAALQNAVALLASDDDAVQRQALMEILNAAGFAERPEGRLIASLADRGLLSLLDRLPEVRSAARTVAEILDGGVLRRLQIWINERLNLERVIAVVERADFDTLDSFLVGRLAAFLDRQIDFGDLDEIRKAINLVVTKRQEMFAKARKALTTRYGFEIAATWQRTTSRTALLDVVFDMSSSSARRLLKSVLADAAYDELFLTPDPAVQLNAAVLTHEITRKSTLEVTLPKLNLRTESFNQSMAKVTAEDDGGRILLYQADATDIVRNSRNRYQSSLSITLNAAIPAPNGAAFNDLRLHSPDSATWSYQLLHARAGMHREELEYYTRPFILQFLSDQFTHGANLSAWYSQFDRTVENVLRNGPDEFGDVLASFEVSIPGRALTAWLTPLDDVESGAKRVSLAIQHGLKRVVPFYYFQDTDELALNPSSAALLVWSAMRPSTSVRTEGSRLVFDDGKSVFWNHPDPELRRMMVDNAITTQNLRAEFQRIRLRLEEAGRHRDARHFDEEQTPVWIAQALTSFGDTLLSSLCFFEARVVEEAATALRQVQKFQTAATASPSKAIERMAEFGAGITRAFNKLTGETVYGKAPLRSLGQLVFLEATRALAGGIDAQPRAMLTLTVLNNASARRFQLETFLAGEIPEADDIAVAQRLVSGA